MVESMSMVIGSSPGPAPNPQARESSSSLSRSSWRTCPKVNARRNVPRVDGAITPCPRTLPVEPERRTSQSSMQSAPAAMACTKVLTLVHAMAAGADCIDDCDVLRSGSTGKVLGHGVMAPSTLGTFLRAFTFGHVRQLDRLSEELLSRAWGFGAGPGEEPMTIDIDSTICQVYGKQKQGSGYGYTSVLGQHPLIATRADTGEVLHIRHRKGSANSGRGAQRFVRETVGRVRRAGAVGPLTLRADSGFYSKQVVAACRDHDVRYSITVSQNKAV